MVSRRAVLKAIATAYPERCVSNEDLSESISQWTPAQILEKTGIRNRHVSTGETTADLACSAAAKLLSATAIPAADVDLLILCTQSPDHPLPATACVIQDRLGLSQSVCAFDINQGCSGYVYGLGIVKAMIESGQATTAILITAERYSQYMKQGDASVRTLFGDAAAASLISVEETDKEYIGPVIYGTDGRGAENLIVRPTEKEGPDASPLGSLCMNGPEIFTFTLKAVPLAVEQVLRAAAVTLADIDYVVLHQANSFMIQHLRRKLGIPEERFAVCLEDCGNTVSCSIPIALESAGRQGILKPGMRVLLVGFGVGYSWGATLIRWAG